jgi:hypothetical protein
MAPHSKFPFVDRDNDLRCRVHRRANIMFGFESSEEKNQFVKEEFRKRQLKRRGNHPSAVSDNTSPHPDDAYTAILNNPEFAKVFSDLIAEKGLGNFTNDVPMLLEYLKSTLSPENLRTFFNLDEMAEETGVMEEVAHNSISTALDEAPIGQAAMLDTGHTTVLELQAEVSQPELTIQPELARMIRPIPIAPPIPRLRVAAESPTPTMRTAMPPPVPPVIHIPIPVPKPVSSAPVPAVTNRVQQLPPPPQDRIRAFGFPPTMQSR